VFNVPNTPSAELHYQAQRRLFLDLEKNIYIQHDRSFVGSIKATICMNAEQGR
jgi:hypothetical protein